MAAPAVPLAGASRLSRLTFGTRLVHADLHNHTVLSDGGGDPADAFASMRAAGLDVAALTDHATLSDNVLGDVLRGALPPEYTQLGGLTPAGWERTGQLADDADAPGAFAAIRGFEWSEPLLGHVNVWFSEQYVDVLQAMTMRPLFDWLLRDTDVPLLDGGSDGLAGFNNPGREQGRRSVRGRPQVRRLRGLGVLGECPSSGASLRCPACRCWSWTPPTWSARAPTAGGRTGRARRGGCTNS